MSTIELKVTRIGNSRGVRLPAATLRRYRIGRAVLMQERSDGIMLRPAGPTVEKLSWEDTARETAASAERWTDWDAVVGDGLAAVPWEDRTQRVSERMAPYGTKPPAGRGTRGKRGAS